jgi:hypothetical protein
MICPHNFITVLFMAFSSKKEVLDQKIDFYGKVYVRFSEGEIPLR